MITFRIPAAKDASILSRLHAEMFFGTGETGWSDTFFASTFASPVHQSLLLNTGEADIGFCLWTHVADEAEILTIGITPAFQKKGYGRNLLDEVIRQNAQKGIKNLYPQWLIVAANITKTARMP